MPSSHYQQQQQLSFSAAEAILRHRIFALKDAQDQWRCEEPRRRRELATGDLIRYLTHFFHGSGGSAVPDAADAFTAVASSAAGNGSLEAGLIIMALSYLPVVCVTLWLLWRILMYSARLLATRRSMGTALDTLLRQDRSTTTTTTTESSNSKENNHNTNSSGNLDHDDDGEDDDEESDAYSAVMAATSLHAELQRMAVCGAPLRAARQQTLYWATVKVAIAGGLVVALGGLRWLSSQAVWQMVSLWWSGGGSGNGGGDGFIAGLGGLWMGMVAHLTSSESPQSSSSSSSSLSSQPTCDGFDADCYTGYDLSPAMTARGRGSDSSTGSRNGGGSYSPLWGVLTSIQTLYLWYWVGAALLGVVLFLLKSAADGAMDVIAHASTCPHGFSPSSQLPSSSPLLQRLRHVEDVLEQQQQLRRVLHRELHSANRSSTSGGGGNTSISIEARHDESPVMASAVAECQGAETAATAAATPSLKEEEEEVDAAAAASEASSTPTKAAVEDSGGDASCTPGRKPAAIQRPDGGSSASAAAAAVDGEERGESQPAA